jgi:hypothetical protein
MTFASFNILVFPAVFSCQYRPVVVDLSIIDSSESSLAAVTPVGRSCEVLQKRRLEVV